MFVLVATGSKKPDRAMIVDRQFPVRLRVALRGQRGDWHNQQTRAALLKIACEGNYGTTVSLLWSAEPRTCTCRISASPSRFFAPAPISS